MINHIFLFLLQNLGLISQVKFMLVDDQNFLVFFMENLNSTFTDINFLFAGEEGLVQCDVVGRYGQLEVICSLDFCIFLGDSEGETIGVESFILVYLWFTKYFQVYFILAVIYLYKSRYTLEYSGPIYSFNILLRTPNLVL